MKLEAINPAGVMPPRIPASPGIRIGELIFLGGQIGRDAAGNLAGPDIRSQTRQVMENIKACLEASGSSLDKVVKTLVFLADMADYQAMNEVYGSYFTREPRPARSTVAVAALVQPELKIEIEVVATV